MPNENTLQHPDQPRLLFSAWVWAVVLFVFFGAIVAITFGAMHRGPTYENDRAQARAEKLKTAREAWTKTADSYGWVDEKKGVAHIPVARAMELEMTDLQNTKPAPAGPIATPEPAAVPVSATGAAQPTSPTATTPGTTSQPEPNAPPPPAPEATTEVAPVSPTVTPVQHAVGTALPIPGKTTPPPQP